MPRLTTGESADKDSLLWYGTFATIKQPVLPAGAFKSNEKLIWQGKKFGGGRKGQHTFQRQAQGSCGIRM